MDRTVEEIIAESKRNEVGEFEKLQASVGEICDAWRGYIDISGEWKTAADEAFGIDFHESRRDLFTGRAASLSVLTTKILMRAGEMPKLLSSGAIESMVVNWRYMSEAKNIAMEIYLDIESSKGFLWLHHGMIDEAKAGGAGDDSEKFAELSNQILADAGFGDKKRHLTAVDRCQRVWHLRTFPQSFTKRERAYMAEAEKELIRVANGFAHPTLVTRERIKDTIHPVDVLGHH